VDSGGRAAADGAIRNEVAAELSRRELIGRASALGLAATIAAALPAAARMARPEPAAAADPSLIDGTLQAFFDTMIPGRRVEVTELGNPVHPRAISGVDPEPGAVEADALLLARNPKLGFSTLEPVFLADLEARSLSQGGLFLDLDYEARERVCLLGLEYSNPDRVIWEAAAALPFTAFCAAASIPNATRKSSVGYGVMGHPGTAPRGYRDFSYRRKLNRGRTKRGYLR
jgi:hypothetical protein